KGEKCMPRLGEMRPNALVAVVGEAVADFRVSNMLGEGEKVDAAITWEPGGGGYNSACSASSFGAQIALVSLVGRDPFGSVLMDRMRECLDCVLPARLLEHTRVSVIIDGRQSFVARYPVKGTLPSNYESVI